MKRDSRNLEVFAGAEGFSKVTGLLRWVDASFPTAATEKAFPLWPSAPGWSEAGRSEAAGGYSGFGPGSRTVEGRSFRLWAGANGKRITKYSGKRENKNPS